MEFQKKYVTEEQGSDINKQSGIILQLFNGQYIFQDDYPHTSKER